MNGHVFELPAKPNQFTKTLEMLRQYANITYDSAHELQSLFDENPTVPTVSLPADEPTPTKPIVDAKGSPVLDSTGAPTFSISTRDRRLHEKSIDQFLERTQQLKTDLNALFSVIFGQCNDAMQSHLRTSTSYLTKRRSSDCLWLLDEIRSAISRFEPTQFVFIAAHEAMSRFFNMCQHDHSNNDYYQAFLNQVAVLERNHVWSPPPLKLCADPHLRGSTDAETRANAHQQFLATTFLLDTDHRRYGTLVYELRNQYTSGQNRFPLTPLEAYKLLNAREKNNANRCSRLANTRCRPPPHGPPDADNKTKTPLAPPPTEPPCHHQYLMHHHLSFLAHNPLPADTILLDTGATDSLFHNPTLLLDIQPRNPPPPHPPYQRRPPRRHPPRHLHRPYPPYSHVVQPKVLSQRPRPLRHRPTPPRDHGHLHRTCHPRPPSHRPSPPLHATRLWPSIRPSAPQST